MDIFLLNPSHEYRCETDDHDDGFSLILNVLIFDVILISM